jgi:hypothetical protein
MKHNSSRMFLFQSLIRVEMEMIKQMSSLARHFSSHFSKQCKSSRPTPVGLRTRLGQRTPERMPPMTPEQQSQQQAAFENTGPQSCPSKNPVRGTKTGPQSRSHQIHTK